MSETVHKMFSSIAGKYDIANDVLSFGMHRLWRKHIVRALELKEGDRIIDLCTGTGDVALELAPHVGNSGKVFGIDFVDKMIELANQKSQAQNVEFSVGDAQKVSFPDNFANGVSVSFGIRNVDSTEVCLAEILRLLKPNGRMAILEFGQPKNKLWGMLYSFYSFQIMPLLGGLVTGNFEAYRYLPRTSWNYPSAEQFTEIMNKVGFLNSSYKPIFGGIAYLYTGQKQGS